MSILSTIEKCFEKNNIKYFQGNDSNENIINLPYRGINDRESKISIYLEVDEESERIIYKFIKNANKDKQRNEIQEILLDLNSSLNYGVLSMRADSNTIEYRLDQEIVDDKFSFDKYNSNIIICIKVYEELKERDLI